MPTDTDERNLDLHNAAIDELLARTGRCGAVHLPTGRTCSLPARHPGGCAFGETGRAFGERASMDPEP